MNKTTHNEAVVREPVTSCRQWQQARRSGEVGIFIFLFF